MQLTQITSDVFQAQDEISSLGSQEVAFLREAVKSSSKGRIRINLHPDKDDLLHEMIIALDASTYVSPHKHFGKSEAFHAIYGSATVIVFDDLGNIEQYIELEAGEESQSFYYRMSVPRFHTLIINSDVFIVHEITNGPFVPGASQYGDFAPAENEKDEAATYLEALRAKLRKLGWKR